MDSTLGKAQRGWSSRAHEEISGLRRAITTHLDEPMVASPAAPMMGELLTRLEGFSNPRDVADLRPPEPPDGDREISRGEAKAALHEACGTLRQRLLAGGDDPQTSGNLQAMVQVIENHLEMKSEVVARSTSDATPG